LGGDVVFKAEFVFDWKDYCSRLEVHARVEIWVLQCRLKASFDRDGKGFRIWSKMQMMKLHDGRIGL